MQNLRKNLSNNIWNKKKDYYKKASHSDIELEKFDTYRKLKKYSHFKNSYYKILDVGSGEGSVLSYISKGKDHNNYYGIDISALALKLAKEKYPKMNFSKVNSEKIPFNNNEFDLTYTTYTLEHLINPTITINEMIRITKNNGYCVFLCPNYGSPIYPSPCYKGNRIIRVLRKFIYDLKYLIIYNSLLGWERVEPIIDKKSEHIMDHDTTIEPYLLLLRKFIEKNTKHTIIECDSQWSTINKIYGATNFTILKSLPFKILGKYLHLYPFNYWGPTLFMVIKIRK